MADRDKAVEQTFNTICGKLHAAQLQLPKAELLNPLIEKAYAAADGAASSKEREDALRVLVNQDLRPNHGDDIANLVARVLLDAFNRTAAPSAIDDVFAGTDDVRTGPVELPESFTSGGAQQLSGFPLRPDQAAQVRGYMGMQGFPMGIKLSPTIPEPDDVRRLFWKTLRNRSDAISFERYSAFIDSVLCCKTASGEALTQEAKDLHAQLASRSLAYGADAYELLKLSTDSFLMHEAGLLNPIALETGRFTFGNHAKLSRGLTSDDETGHIPGRAGHQETIQKLALDLRREYLKALPGEIAPAGKTLPYLKLIIAQLDGLPTKPDECLGLGGDCYGILRSRVQYPCMLELIWSYWMEESGLVQTMKALSLRFQNKRSRNLRNPLERIALDPLRPLSNLLWGFVEDEPARLSLNRRVHSYREHYGFQIEGKAVEKLQSIDTRRGFIAAFHTLLNLCSTFFRELDDNTVTQDGFPVLNALKEVHLLLCEGMHNQYGDLPWQARKEMLMMQWLTARPEMQQFLGGRVMVPYREDWMGRVETMRRMQGWGHKPINHYRDLAVFGELLLLSIRFGSWVEVDSGSVAADWAVFFRTEIQSYIHAYRSLTGVDLTGDQVNHQMPSKLLRRGA